jgi:hypothetical protein
MSSVDKCQFCGVEALSPREEMRTLTVPYGPPVQYKSAYFVCGSCNEEIAGDEEAKEAALQQAIVASVRSMLDHLAKDGISSAYLERALRIPQRTTARWKEGKVSAAAVALLRAVRSYPWLLSVADANFGTEAIYQFLIGASTLAVPPSTLIEKKSQTAKHENRLVTFPTPIAIQP